MNVFNNPFLTVFYFVFAFLSISVNAVAQPYAGSLPANGTYDKNIIAIGEISGVPVTNASAAGLTIKDSTFLTSSGDYVAAGHRIKVNSASDSLLPGSITSGSHWLREWYVDITDNSSDGGIVIFGFDLTSTDITGTPGDAANYKLFYRGDAATTPYTVITGARASVSGTTVNFVLDVNRIGLKDGIFTLGTVDDNNSPLPVKLISFTGKYLHEGAILLNWATASEKNSDRFFIERSVDGKIFTEVGDILTSGNSTITRHYSFTDKNPLGGTNFYRLRQVDFDGTTEYFDVIAVYVANSADVEVRPTAVENHLTVYVNATATTEYNITLTALSGKTHVSTIEKLSAGSHEIDVPVAHVRPGIYVLNVNGQTFRVIKM